MGRKVTIIIPVYNAGNKLKKCIESILKQSYEDYEVVLVDDGSTDTSGRICDKYAKRDNRICVIHQMNKGSVEARKAGVFSALAQDSEYLMFCDADDTLPQDALKILITNAERNQADCVCGDMRRMVRSIVIPRFLYGYTPPCFKIDSVQIYFHDDIMNKLYVSCFGISNYPVNLCAKLYSRKLLTDAMQNNYFIQFMGDDLSVTLNIMPKIEKLVVLPDTVYHYRMGGGTAKFMPNMLNDFLTLYRYKKKLIKKYNMKENVDVLVDIELLNESISYLQMCKSLGKFENDRLNGYIEKTIDIAEIRSASQNCLNMKSRAFWKEWAKWINEEDVKSIIMYLNSWNRHNRLKRFIKIILIG